MQRFSSYTAVPELPVIVRPAAFSCALASPSLVDPTICSGRDTYRIAKGRDGANTRAAHWSSFEPTSIPGRNASSTSAMRNSLRRSGSNVSMGFMQGLGGLENVCSSVLRTSGISIFCMASSSSFGPSSLALTTTVRAVQTGQ